MAYNIKYYPPTFSSTQGDLIFTVYEDVKSIDPSTYPDYKYVADIYIDGTMVARLKSVPNPVSKFGIFNIANIVRNYINPSFDPKKLAPMTDSVGPSNMGNGGSFSKVVVKFGEEYGFALYSNLQQTDERSYYNISNVRLFVSGPNPYVYDFQNSFVTVRPRTTKISRNSLYNFITTLRSTGEADYGWVAELYDSNMVMQNSFFNSLSYTSDDGVYQMFNVSVYSLTEFKRQLDGNPSLVVFPDNIKYIKFFVSNGFSIEYDTFWYELVCESQYKMYEVHFLNRFGAFESKMFSKVSRGTISIEKESFGKLEYTIDANGAPQYYNTTTNTYNEASSVYSSQFKEKMQLNTDLLTDQEYDWLQDLIVSPMVYVSMSGYHMPAKITATEYERKKYINDRLTNLTIDVEFGNQYNAQYR